MNAVVVVKMRQIIAGLTAVKRKFENLHPGPAGIVKQFLNGRCDKTQVFRDKAYAAEPVVENADKLHTGSLFPTAPFCGFAAVRHCPVFVERPSKFGGSYLAQGQVASDNMEIIASDGVEIEIDESESEPVLRKAPGLKSVRSQAKIKKNIKAKTQLTLMPGVTANLTVKINNPVVNYQISGS